MEDRSRGRYATPANFPQHGCSLYRRLRVSRWGLGFVHRSRAIFCRAVANPNVTIRNFLRRCKVAAWRRARVATDITAFLPAMSEVRQGSKRLVLMGRLCSESDAHSRVQRRRPHNHIHEIE